MHTLPRRLEAMIVAAVLAVSPALQASEVRRGLGPEPDSLHIHQAQGLTAVNLLRDIREGLVTFNEHGELVSGQAESWEVLDGGRRYRFTLRADYADPSSFLDLFIGGSALNNTFYRNAEFDMLLKSAATTSGSTRMELLRRPETRLMRDMPVIPLYYYVSRHLVNPRINGFSDNVRDIHLSRYLEVVSESP